MATTTFGFQNVTEFATEKSTVQREIFPGFNLIIICVYFAISAVGLIGNGLVIFVTGCKMKTTVNSIWFLNLGIADFICCLTLIINTILSVCSMVLHMNDFKYMFLRYMMLQSSLTSIFLLTTISLDRCLCTWMVVWARNKRTLIKARITCMIVWVVSIVCCIPAVFNHSPEESDGYYTYSTQYYKSLVPYRFTVSFMIPFLIIASSYVAIGVRVKRLKKKRPFRSYRVIIAAVLAFFICWLPFHVHKFFYLCAKENHWNESSKDALLKTASIVDYMVFLNSCLNPIIYVFMCDEYKKKLKKSLLVVLETAFVEDHLDSKCSKHMKDQYACLTTTTSI